MKQATQGKLKSQSLEKSGQPKPLQQNKNKLAFVFLDIALLLFVIIGAFFVNREPFVEQDQNENVTPTFTPVPVPTPTPTPKPLTFAEMNSMYGPCVTLPVLMYHHVQSREAALANNQTNLTVYTDVFSSQMQYLKTRGYNAVSMDDLVNFFDMGTAIPAKSVLITFDDGYADFYTDAYPVLSGVGFKATMFISTGLMQNYGYLSWSELNNMSSLVLFANHTWSHKNVAAKDSAMEKEISTADIQLADHGFNSPKIFAYPYGPDSIPAENYLNSLNYKAAFTTQIGNILCKQQRLSLPRVRVGNSPLSNYGF